MRTRREFVAGLAAGLFAPAAFAQQASAPPTSLFIPPLVDVPDGGRFSLEAMRTRHAFLPGRPAQAYGYSQSLLGPTFRLSGSSRVTAEIKNSLGRETTVHWHGLAVPGDVDGGPHNTIATGAIWTPSLRIDQAACTAWYHAHPHGATAHQVYGGLAGMIVVEDGSSAAIGLPRTYGVDDLPIIIQDRTFDADGALIYDASPMSTMTGFAGDTVIVNGCVAPVAHVPQGIVRLRLLDGANSSPFRLAFSDRRSFHVIASDGGLLAAAVAMTEIVLSPGERYEILADFSNGAPVEFVSRPVTASRGMMGMMVQRQFQQRRNTGVMRFVPDKSLPVKVSSVPVRLADIPRADPGSAERRRSFSLDMMMGMGGMGLGGMGMGMRGMAMGINGAAFDMDRIDADVKLHSREIWQVSAPDMAHPFHVHGVSFRVLNMNGRTPPPHLSGWKDVLLVDGTAEILIGFDQPASRSKPFMYHCHILEHEDAGMMGQFSVS